MYALLRSRTRSQAGFGMIELLLAMTVLSVGVLATFAMFQSSTVQIKRASTVATAGALADTEIENYRAVKYETIGLPDTAVTGADATYKGDSAYRAVSNPVNALDSSVVVAACPATPCTSSVPTKTLTGADGKSYRVDTYITWQKPASADNGGGVSYQGRPVKLVTVVVRDSARPHTYARAASTFDESTGS